MNAKKVRFHNETGPFRAEKVSRFDRKSSEEVHLPKGVQSERLVVPLN